MSNTCKDCDHWSRRPEGELVPRIGRFGDCSCFWIKAIDKYYPTWEMMESGLYIDVFDAREPYSVISGENFGCVHFERKER